MLLLQVSITYSNGPDAVTTTQYNIHSNGPDAVTTG